MDWSAELARLFEQVRVIALLETTQAVLEWDERTGLPSRAGDYRAEQVTELSGLIHRRRTEAAYADRLRQLVDRLPQLQLDLQSASSLQLLYRDYQRDAKLPTDLVQAIAKASVLGQQAWERARAVDDWALFQPSLTEMIRLKREEAQLLSDGGCLYDALLDHYERGARIAPTTKDSASVETGQPKLYLSDLFTALRDSLCAILDRLRGAPSPPDGQSWSRPVEVHRQRAISRWVAEQIGFDFGRGRLDETSHPFCTTLGPHDCRILTRYQEDYFPCGFYGTLHEAGHGLYEQGLPVDWFGLPAGKFASLGVHESQSRLWENFVGRSQPFWDWAFDSLVRQVGGAWDGLRPETIVADANLIRPSLIRVEADEVTYNLHILIRFELEQQLIAGELQVADAPQAWDESYQRYLGVRSPSPRDGILQDVHWSAGLIGYFPTYTLGNLYAAQLMQAAGRELGDLDRLLRSGQFIPLLDWLRQRVHAQGACQPPAELVATACGSPLSHQPLIDYLSGKLYPIYGL